jgi:biotin carboxyl carrier protein
MKFKRVGGSEREVEVATRPDGTMRTRIDGEEITATLEMLCDGSAMLAVDGRRYRVSGTRRANAILVAAGALSTEYQIVEARRGAHAAGLTAPTIDAPMPGAVLKILVKEGARVETNDPLIVLEAMKTETTLSAESPAIIKRICVQVGQRVDHGATLIELGPLPEQPAAPSS